MKFLNLDGAPGGCLQCGTSRYEVRLQVMMNQIEERDCKVRYGMKYSGGI